MTNPVLVTGGTGTLGRAVVQQLLRAGSDVRVLSRRPPPAATGPLPYAWITADLRNAEAVSDAVAGVSAIIHCATTSGPADIDVSRHLFEAARRSGNPLLVYISIVGIDVVPLRYYRAKLEVERLLATARLPWTVLRATQFHDLITGIFRAQRWSPALLVPAGVSCQPIDVREVAGRLVELAGRPAAGRLPDVGGPLVQDFAELARMYLRASGRRQLILPVRVPGGTMRAFRAGGHLAPERAFGRIPFDAFIAEHVITARRTGAERLPRRRT